MALDASTVLDLVFMALDDVVIVLDVFIVLTSLHLCGVDIFMASEVFMVSDIFMVLMSSWHWIPPMVWVMPSWCWTTSSRC